MQRRIFAGFWLETFQSFLVDLNEKRSLLNPVLRGVKRGPVFEVALDHQPLRDCLVFRLGKLGTFNDTQPHYSAYRNSAYRMCRRSMLLSELNCSYFLVPCSSSSREPVVSSILKQGRVWHPAAECCKKATVREIIVTACILVLPLLSGSCLN